MRVDTEKKVVSYCNIEFDDGSHQSFTMTQVRALSQQLSGWLEQQEYEELVNEGIMPVREIDAKTELKEMTGNKYLNRVVRIPRATLEQRRQRLMTVKETVNKLRTQIELNNNELLPPGYVIIGRVISKRNGFEDRTYVLGENAATGSFGFRIVNGKISSFMSIGKISDPTSSIGALIRMVPDGAKFTSSDFAGLSVMSDGRRLKAAIEILTIKGYLTRTGPDLDRRGRVCYLRTAKNDGMEDGRTVPVTSSKPTEQRGESNSASVVSLSS